MSEPHTEGSLAEMIRYRAKNRPNFFFDVISNISAFTHTLSGLMTLTSICENAGLTSRSRCFLSPESVQLSPGRH